MIIIEREISEYTHHKIIIGIFENIEKAHIAKEEYIEFCKEKDKWAEQAYRTVDLDKDVMIRDVATLLEIGDEKSNVDQLYVVSYFMEGFGQITRVTEKIFTDQSKAKQYIALKKEEEAEYEPSWYDIDDMRINKIYFDN